MKRLLTATLMLSALCLGALSSAHAIKVVATIPDLAFFAKEIGGSKATVTTICPGTVNPHFLETKPSHVEAIANADLFLEVGLALDLWGVSLRRAAANKRMVVITTTRGCTVLEKPKGPVDPSQGHLHPQGNPHLWLHPGNAMIICSNILAGFKAADPKNSAYYTDNARELLEKIKSSAKKWSKQLAPCKGAGYVSYHPSYEYFADFAGLRKIATIEPKPGVPPPSGRVAEVLKLVKANNVKLILQEPYYPSGAAKAVAAATEARFILAPTLSGSLPGTDTWFDMMQYLVDKVVSALK